MLLTKSLLELLFTKSESVKKNIGNSTGVSQIASQLGKKAARETNRGSRYIIRKFRADVMLNRINGDYLV